jgi:hypothetical protein
MVRNVGTKGRSHKSPRSGVSGGPVMSGYDTRANALGAHASTHGNQRTRRPPSERLGARRYFLAGDRGPLAR